MTQKLKLVLLAVFGSAVMVFAYEKTDDDHTNSGKFVHTVYFKLKQETHKQLVLRFLRTVKNIKVLKSIEIGNFIDTDNPKNNQINN